jgi:hypothetical protein
MTEQLARFNPGDNIPVFAKAAVNAGRFLAIVDGKTTQGDYPVEHASAEAAHPFGVAEVDSAAATESSYSVERRINCIRPGAIARVVAGAEVKAKDLVAVGTGGKAVKVAGEAPAVGRALTTGKADEIIEVELF